MKPTVYVETSIISYLASRPSRDVVQAAHQKITHAWWERRGRFALFASEIVVREASAGDPKASAKRLATLENVPLLRISNDAADLADELLRISGIPRKASADALHIAIATAHGMEYLLTWNCKHIANALLRSKIEVICRSNGYEPPVICTPEELAKER